MSRRSRDNEAATAHARRSRRSRGTEPAATRAGISSQAGANERANRSRIFKMRIQAAV